MTKKQYKRISKRITKNAEKQSEFPIGKMVGRLACQNGADSVNNFLPRDEFSDDPSCPSLDCFGSCDKEFVEGWGYDTKILYCLKCGETMALPEKEGDKQ